MAEIFTSINKMRGEVSNDERVDEKVEKIFAKIDADGNGEISKEEFLEGVKDEQSIVEAFSVYENLSWAFFPCLKKRFLFMKNKVLKILKYWKRNLANNHIWKLMKDFVKLITQLFGKIQRIRNMLKILTRH